MVKKATNIEGPSPRILRVGEEMRRVIAEIMLKEKFFSDSLSISITEVRMTADLKHATIFYYPLGGGIGDNRDFRKNLQSALQEISKDIRYLIPKKLNLKYVPELHFKLDESFENSLKIDTLLKDI